MTDILIREIDEYTARALRRKADELNLPVETVARDILRRSVKFSPQERRVYADRIRAMTPRPLRSESVGLMRLDRDER